MKGKVEMTTYNDLLAKEQEIKVKQKEYEELSKAFNDENNLIIEWKEDPTKVGVVTMKIDKLFPLSHMNHYTRNQAIFNFVIAIFLGLEGWKDNTSSMGEKFMKINPNDLSAAREAIEMLERRRKQYEEEDRKANLRI